MFNTHSKQPQASTSQPKTLAPKALALCILALVLCFSAVDRTRLWLLIKTMVCLRPAPRNPRPWLLRRLRYAFWRLCCVSLLLTEPGFGSLSKRWCAHHTFADQSNVLHSFERSRTFCDFFLHALWLVNIAGTWWWWWWWWWWWSWSWSWWWWWWCLRLTAAEQTSVHIGSSNFF